MAIAWDSVAADRMGKAVAITSAGCNQTITIIPGQTVVVMALSFSGLSVASVVDDSANVYLPQSSDTATNRIEIWTCLNAPSPATSITVKWNSPSGNVAMSAMQYSGVHSIGTSSSVSTTNDVSIAVKTQDANNFIVAGSGEGAGSTAVSTVTTGNTRANFTAGSGATLIAWSMGDNTSASPASVTVAFGSNHLNKVSAGVELRTVDVQPSSYFVSGGINFSRKIRVIP